MSYRNPKQIVDTQSGQYIRDMQKSLADTFSKYSGSINTIMKEQAKRNDALAAESQKRVNRISGQVNQVANANKAINFDQMYANLDTYDQYMKINPAKRTREMNLFIRGMDNSGINIKDKLANTVAAGEPFMEARKKGIGVPGGIYSGVKNLKKYDVMYGFNQAPGSKKMNYNPVTNEFRISVLGGSGESLGSSLNEDMEHLDTPQVVPDETKNMKELAAKVAARMDLKNPNSPAYADQEYQMPTEVNNINYLSKLPSRNVFMGLATDLAKAEVGSMNAGDAIALFNDVTRGEGVELMEWQKTWTDPNDPRKKIITDSYAEHVANKFGQEILLTAGPRIKQIDKPQGEADDNASSKPTAQQIATKELIKTTTESIKAIDSTKLKSPEQIADAVDRLGLEPRISEDGSIAIFKGNIQKTRIPAGSNITKIKEALAVASGLTLSQATEAVKNSKSEVDKFAEEWDKNNPGPISDAFRTQEIMRAYEEFKKKNK